MFSLFAPTNVICAQVAPKKTADFAFLVKTMSTLLKSVYLTCRPNCGFTCLSIHQTNVMRIIHFNLHQIGICQALKLYLITFEGKLSGGLGGSNNVSEM